MPTNRRKRVLLTEPSPSLLADDPAREVFYLAQTGEIFPDYQSYSARLSFYRTKQFQCDVTGKGGLDYFQALESEQQEARTLHARFPEQLKAAVLRAVQWQVMGRLDHLVEAVYERFKDRYFHGERVFVDVKGDKFWARVMKITAPPTDDPASSPKRAQTDGKAAPAPPRDRIHQIGGNLQIPLEVSFVKDDPKGYIYQVQTIDDAAPSPVDRPKNGNTVMDVSCSVMSRDRLAFSKSILRRFIRDCVDRDAAVASPWTVKRAIAQRYGVEVEMPEATRKGVEDIKRGEIEKRKKVWEDRDGPPAKKQKKLSPDERAALLKEEQEELAQIEKEEIEREAAAAAVKKRKKPVKFPTEDLDVRLTEKEKKAGIKAERPLPNRDLPFESSSGGVFESFLMSWNFLHIFAKPMGLATFTLDEYEHAIRHSVPEPPCVLIAEAHVALLGILKSLSTAKRHPAVISLLEEKEIEEQAMHVDDTDKAADLNTVSIDRLVDALNDVGNTWEKSSLKAIDNREGWEDAVVGCIKDNATTSSFPRLRAILTQLLFRPATAGKRVASVSSDDSSNQDLGASTEFEVSSPDARYHALPVADKIAILSFLCDLGITSKPIHSYMDACEVALTELRKEKIEVNRDRKKCIEDMNQIVEKAGGGVTDGKEGKLAKEPKPAKEVREDDDDDEEDMLDSGGSDQDSERATPLASDGGSSLGNMRSTTGSARQRALRIKAQNQAHAKQLELARGKGTTAKQALADHKRLSDEVLRHDRKLESIEREFRKLLGVVRLRPMGKDRFHNRIWWFDGVGGGSLVSSSGTAMYGSGRVFIQGPSQIDWELLAHREKTDGDVLERRLDEETADGMLEVGQWAMFDEVEQLEEFFAWLSGKGNREIILRNTLTKWWDHILAGVKKRHADMLISTKMSDARRSTRAKHAGASDLSREPYMLWSNRKGSS